MSTDSSAGIFYPSFSSLKASRSLTPLRRCLLLPPYYSSLTHCSISIPGIHGSLLCISSCIPTSLHPGPAIASSLSHLSYSCVSSSKEGALSQQAYAPTDHALTGTEEVRILHLSRCFILRYYSAVICIDNVVSLSPPTDLIYYIHL